MQRKEGSINGPEDRDMIPADLMQIVNQIRSLADIADNIDKATRVVSLIKAVYSHMLELHQDDGAHFPFNINTLVKAGYHPFKYREGGIPFYQLQPQLISTKSIKLNSLKLAGIISSFKDGLNKSNIGKVEEVLDQLKTDLRLNLHHQAFHGIERFILTTRQLLETQGLLSHAVDQLKADLGFKNACVIS